MPPCALCKDPLIFLGRKGCPTPPSVSSSQRMEVSRKLWPLRDSRGQPKPPLPWAPETRGLSLALILSGRDPGNRDPTEGETPRVEELTEDEAHPGDRDPTKGGPPHPGDRHLPEGKPPRGTDPI